jgi:hypothetical protein
MSMVTIAPVFADSLRREGADTAPSAVSWPAVFAGAVAAAALSLILLVLGTGLGLSVVSPWAARGASAEAMSWSTILWISFCALASSGLGGYIAGRLRVKWPAVRSLYTVESLFRTAPAATAPVNPATPASPSQPDASAADTRSEIARIFDNGIHDGPLSAEDTRYIGQIVAQRTGLSQPEAEARVTTIYTTAQQKLQQAEAAAKEAADQARKAGAYAALWIFVSLLMGAFFASLMATVGGRRRDQF